MPKSPGQSLKLTRGPSMPQPPSRPILRQTAPPPLPPSPSTPPTPSNEIAAEAVRIASSPGGIDPRQQHN
jgi:hypothetical protein